MLSFKSLQDILCDENECIKFLIEKKILVKPKKCLLCRSTMYRDRKVFKCVDKKCQKSQSIFRNTFFSTHRLKCSDTMFIAYFWLCRLNHTMIFNVTGHPPNTVVKYMRLFRELVIRTLHDDDQVIGGHRIVVEVDESKFQKSRDDKGIWIVGGIERTNERKCFFKVVEQRDSKTIKDIISKHVRPGSTVFTDSWKGYSEIKNLNITHRRVNHTQGFISNTGAHTNTIEGTWSGLKRKIQPRFRGHNTINEHLLEFIWRRKHEKDPWGGFLHALQTIQYS